MNSILDIENIDYLSPDLSVSELEIIGWFKIVRIRNFSIHLRHVYKAIFLKKMYFPIVAEFWNKYFGNWKMSMLEAFTRLQYNAMRKSHRQRRDGKLPILQIFDFDRTLTRFKSLVPTEMEYIGRILDKGLYPNFWNKEKQYHPDLGVERIVVSASGDEESIKRFLEKRGLRQRFSKIFACGGEKNKAHKLFDIRQKWKYDFILYYDDNPLFAIGSLLFSFLPYWVDGLRIRKIDLDGKNETLDKILSQMGR